MAVSRAIKSRIRSVRSTRQITKAMELVSAAKMRRVSGATVAGRPYHQALQNIISGALAGLDEDFRHPLLEPKQIPHSLLILISSDRGQAGAFTSNLVKRALAYIETENAAGRSVACVTLGKKGDALLRAAGASIIQHYPLPSGLPTQNDLEALTAFCLKQFGLGRFGKVDLIYTNFISLLNNEAVTEPLLPLTLEETATNQEEVLFEPSPEEVLDQILPYIVSVYLYQALLESAASEHSARRLAMKNATDNAVSMLESLNLTYNRLRQGAITQEIAEITAGSSAANN